jgi:hypothetical protein
MTTKKRLLVPALVLACAAGPVAVVTAHERPTVRDFSFSPSTFAATTSASAAAASGGTTIRFRLSEKASRVTIAFRRGLSGRKVHRRCAKPTSALRKRPACTRWVSVGAVTKKNVPAGRRALRFSGRVGGRQLAPGRYRATIVAVDKDHDRSKRKTATFTVKRASTSPPSGAPTPAPAPPPGSNPAPGGFPNPSSTGVPAGWVPAQTRSTDMTVNTAGAVVQDVLFTNGAKLSIDAPNVTVRRVRLQGGMIETSSPGVVIEDTTIDRTAPETNGGEGVISYCGYTARRVAILERSEGPREGCLTSTPTVIENSFISIKPSDACLNGTNTDWHGDGIQGYQGRNLIVTNVTIDFQAGNPPGECGGTSPFFYDSNNGKNNPNGHAVINGLLLKGGGYSFRLGTPGSVQGLRIVNNSWGFGPIIIDGPGCSAITPWEAKIVTVDANWQPTRVVRDLPCR